MKSGIAIIIVGILLASVFVNNAIIYPLNATNNILAIQQQAQRMGWEPETIQLLTYSILSYNPTDSFTLLFAPSLQDLYSRGFILDQLIKAEKLLGQAIATEGAEISQLADAVNNLSYTVLVIQQNQVILYENQKTLQEELNFLSQRVAYLQNVTANMSAAMQSLASRVAGLEAQVTKLISQPAGAITNTIYSAANTINNIINPQAAVTNTVIKTITQQLDPVTQAVVNYVVKANTNPVINWLNNVFGWFGW